MSLLSILAGMLRAPLLLLLALGSTVAAAAQDVTLKTSDGQSIHAISDGSGDRGVVLVHMEGREASDWGFVSERLARSRMQVVAPDLRGHGRNPARELTEADYLAMIEDVKAAVAFLRARGVKQVSCVGASIGANLCLRVAAADPQIVNVVLLSPGLNRKGVKSVDVLADYGDRPLLIVASEEDQYAVRTATLIEEKAQGQKLLTLLKDAGQGTKMLNRDPNLEGLLVSWLLGTYELAPGSAVMPRPKLDGRIDAVETSGEKLDSHK